MYQRLTSLTRSKALRFYVRLLFRFVFFLFLSSLVLEIILAYLVAGDVRLIGGREMVEGKSLLLVTAHPDDECLFFSPAVLGILGRGRDGIGGDGERMEGGLLVMSSGNNYGLGEVRKTELQGSCAALGIEKDRCVVLDEGMGGLADDPKVWWDEKVVEKKVKEYVKKWKVDVILTFDEGGVSGHINHRAVSAAIRKYAKHDPKAPPVYTLYTTSLPRKYTFILDLPFTSLSFSWRIVKALLSPPPIAAEGYSNKALLTNTWRNYYQTRRAFRSHETQYSWDRNLYMILSRYVWFNDLRRVPGPFS